ncbi:MAG: hypothetical protein JHC93_03645 [Parachlamydiales bacterium]|nr:hypothetical protein [Parachlamydiales bacterium]
MPIEVVYRSKYDDRSLVRLHVTNCVKSCGPNQVIGLAALPILFTKAVVARVKKSEREKDTKYYLAPRPCYSAEASAEAWVNFSKRDVSNCDYRIKCRIVKMIPFVGEDIYLSKLIHRHKELRLNRGWGYSSA